MTAPLRRGRHGEAHQRTADPGVPVRAQDREPVALPQGAAEGVEPDGPGRDAVDQPDDVHGGRVVVTAVPVVAGEQALLVDEHDPPDAVVLGQLGGAPDRPAAERVRR